jgi:hypothetical protein
VSKYKTCPHCRSRYRPPAARRPKPEPEEEMTPERVSYRAALLQAGAWLHFWKLAGEPAWRACAWDVVPGDRG